MEQQKRGYVTTGYYLSNFTEVSSLFHLKLTLCPLGIGKLRIATGMLITNHQHCFNSSRLFGANTLSRRHNRQTTMLKSQTALEENIKRLTARTIGTQLNRSALYKGTSSHNNLILITRQRTRNRLNVRINRRIALNSNTEIAQTLLALQGNSLNNITAAFLRQRLNSIAQALENSSRKNSSSAAVQKFIELLTRVFYLDITREQP